MPRLVIYHPREGSRVFELLGECPVSIGRCKSSNLFLDDASVSLLHALLHATPDGRWQVEDRDSANGLKINGKFVKAAVLRANDEVAIGGYRLRFEDSGGGAKLVSYGTAELPKRVEQVLKESAFSGSSIKGEAIADLAQGDTGARGETKERLRTRERENRLLKLLDRVNRTLGALGSVDQVVSSVLDLVLEIEGAERVFAMLLDEDSIGQADFSKEQYRFEPAAIRCRAKTGPRPDVPTPRLAISRSIIRKVMTGGLPLLVTDAQTDPRLSSSSSIALSGLRSAMCAPLGMGNKVRGLVYVDNLSDRGIFTVEDLNVFAVIAVQAGLAVDRVRSLSEAAPSPKK
jgi:adenylate cyclase